MKTKTKHTQEKTYRRFTARLLAGKLPGGHLLRKARLFKKRMRDVRVYVEIEAVRLLGEG